MIKSILLFIICLSAFCGQHTTQALMEDSADNTTLKALIIDGENNHGVWPMTTMMLKDFLEQTGLFTVDIARTKYTWQGPHFDKSIGKEDITVLLKEYPLKGHQPIPVDEPKPDPNYAPQFDKYDVVITNMGWKASTWSDAVKADFEAYMRNGGGLVVVHAANNSWGDWDAYNEMIGLGGWGGRNTESGPYVYYNDKNQIVYDPSEGDCGSHGPQYEFLVTTREPEHPIMKGLPAQWLHTKDELYERLRGPAKNLTVLATAHADVEKNSPPWNKNVKGSGHHEPMLMTIDYGEGRVFHTAMGHMDYSMECVGFMTTFQRGCEWVATGSVTQKVPSDFPGAAQSSSRKWTR